MDEYKKCGRCNEVKTIQEFGIVSTKCSHRLRSYCKRCGSDYAKESRARRLEKDPQLQIREHLKYRYGITLEEKLNLMLSGCQICSLILSQFNMHVDHCHQSKKIRGILCNNCNRGLGFCKDQQSILVGCISYIIKTSDPNFDLLKTLNDESS